MSPLSRVRRAHIVLESGLSKIPGRVDMRNILDSLDESVLLISSAGCIEFANQAAHKQLGVALGDNFYALATDANVDIRRYFQRCVTTHRAMRPALRLRYSGKQIDIRCVAIAARATTADKQARILIECKRTHKNGDSAHKGNQHKGLPSPLRLQPHLGEDETVNEKQQLLLDEVKHRLKNTIQMVLSILLDEQRRAVGEEARSALDAAARKLRAAVLVQKLLEQPAHEATRADRFLPALCEAIRAASPQDFELALEVDSGEIRANAILPLALMVNELLTNAIKHGICGNGGCVRVALKNCGEKVELRVEDNGPGLTEDKPAKRHSGLSLVAHLARQLDGSFETEFTPSGKYLLRFPAERVFTEGGKAFV